jgi:SAM-dependent methyltransferase
MATSSQLDCPQRCALGSVFVMGPRYHVRRHAPMTVRRAVARRRFGDLHRVVPVSEWGEENGTPVDRWYIERFLEERSECIHGRALEVKGDLYASRFGASSVDVVDIDPANPNATIAGDLCKPGTLPREAFDVAVVTQTLQFLADPAEALRRLVDSLRPGGTLLLTVPTLSRVSDPSDRWRWTPTGMRQLLTSVAPPTSDVECLGLGNGLAGRAFLFGLSAEFLDADVLARPDEHYPLVVGAALRRTA